MHKNRTWKYNFAVESLERNVFGSLAARRTPKHGVPETGRIALNLCTPMLSVGEETDSLISYQCCDHTCNLWHLGPVMVMLRMMMVLMMIMMMAHKRDSNSDVKSCNSSLLTSPASLSVTRRTSKMAMARDVYSFVLRSSTWGWQLHIKLTFRRLFNIFHLYFVVLCS